MVLQKNWKAIIRKSAQPAETVLHLIVTYSMNRKILTSSSNLIDKYHDQGRIDLPIGFYDDRKLFNIIHFSYIFQIFFNQILNKIHREHKFKMLKLMMNFLQTKNCRRRLLLGHLKRKAKITAQTVVTIVHRYAQAKITL